jgi:hypothetical protein
MIRPRLAFGIILLFVGLVSPGAAEVDGMLLERLAMSSSHFFRRMVPALVTRLTMKCPGYEWRPDIVFSR